MVELAVKDPATAPLLLGAKHVLEWQDFKSINRIRLLRLTSGTSYFLNNKNCECIHLVAALGLCVGVVRALGLAAAPLVHVHLILDVALPNVNLVKLIHYIHFD